MTSINKAKEILNRAKTYYEKYINAETFSKRVKYLELFKRESKKAEAYGYYIMINFNTAGTTIGLDLVDTAYFKTVAFVFLTHKNHIIAPPMSL